MELSTGIPTYIDPDDASTCVRLVVLHDLQPEPLPFEQLIATIRASWPTFSAEEHVRTLAAVTAMFEDR